MQGRSDRYTTREEVEALLAQTREGAGKRGAKKTPEPHKRSPWRVVRRIVYGLVIAALLLMLGKVWYARLNGQVPSLFGYQLYVVETGSMIPTLPIGSNILVRELRPGDALQVGDVITYNHGTAAVTHRIIDTVTGDDGVLRYQTKGDNPENSPDPWLVSRDEIRGVMIWHFAWSQLIGQ